MPAINAVVEAISIKEMPSPDKFGNTHRANLKIGEDWFSYGTVKKPQINIKTNGEWNELQKGMEVEFMYDVNGDFKNIKKQSFSITNTAGGQPAQQHTQSAPPTQGSAPQRGVNVNPAEVGQCLNLAAEVLKYSGDDLTNPDKVKVAIQWYKRTSQLFTTLYPVVDVEETLQEKPASKKKATPEVEYDDDI